jgi:hypothetical protein
MVPSVPIVSGELVRASAAAPFHQLSRRESDVIALRDPKITKSNFEKLLDQRILTKAVKGGYVEEIERNTS